MSKIESFNRQNVKLLRVEMEEALKQVAERYDLGISLGSISYMEANFNVRVEVATKSEDGAVISTAALAFKRNSKWDGIKPEALGEKFNFKNKDYTITGWNTRAKKYPVQAEDEQGKGFGFMPKSIRMGLKRRDRDDLLIEGWAEWHRQ